ncbi:MAG: helix-turn-helix domain-containing protein [Phycisphaerae bacterium]
MRSYEVLKRAADGIGVKALAAELRLSPALVYKWCQGWDPEDPDASGARNPLDRVADIVKHTGDKDVVNWLCHEAGGFLALNHPVEPPPDVSGELLGNTQRLVREFSQLLLAVTKSIEDDGEIDPTEADRIRDAWEAFKTTVETFTVACERGLFRDNPTIE